VVDRREFEGIGAHGLDYDEGDYLLVEKWLKRPDDLKGQLLTFGKLLPPEFKAVGLRNYYNGGDAEKNQAPKFRFHITVEVDRTADK
jgi:hypothetical protein